MFARFVESAAPSSWQGNHRYHGQRKKAWHRRDHHGKVSVFMRKTVEVADGQDEKRPSSPHGQQVEQHRELIENVEQNR